MVNEWMDGCIKFLWMSDYYFWMLCTLDYRIKKKKKIQMSTGFIYVFQCLDITLTSSLRVIQD